jgi:hypothetical protein
MLCAPVFKSALNISWNYTRLFERRWRCHMANGSGRGCLTTVLFVIVLLFPLVGHIFLTLMILGDDLTLSEKVLWLIVIWLIPIIGPLLYLLIGQRRNRVLA